MDRKTLNRINGQRIGARQIDELVGLARGLTADGRVNAEEAEFLHAWLVANNDIRSTPIVSILYRRVEQIMSDGKADAEECADLFDTLHRFANPDMAVGEVLKPTTLPLCDPAPVLEFAGMRYSFTGTFNYGKRDECELAVLQRGAKVGNVAQSTNVLVIGAYATDSWKHSTFGNKIIQATEWRGQGYPISIVSESHWKSHL